MVSSSGELPFRGSYGSQAGCVARVQQLVLCACMDPQSDPIVAHLAACLHRIAGKRLTGAAGLASLAVSDRQAAPRALFVVGFPVVVFLHVTEVSPRSMRGGDTGRWSVRRPPAASRPLPLPPRLGPAPARLKCCWPGQRETQKAGSPCWAEFPSIDTACGRNRRGMPVRGEARRQVHPSRWH